VPMLLWHQALLPMLTVWARISYTRRVAAGQKPILDPRQSPRRLDKLKCWRYPRATVPYDLITIANMVVLAFVRIPAEPDPVRQLLGL
jgi:hypothetical protein